MSLAAAVLWLAPAAVAAPPANDEFADREVLIGSLPIEVSRSNVEATKEVGEPMHGWLGDKGHSVWFEWEATSGGFFTVGTCGSDFATVTSIYAGTKVDELTKVAGGFNDEGPGCPAFDGHQVTFKASAGATYAIAVDGDPFYLPPAEPPLGEGTIELQIEATPVPANDDFANPTPLTGTITEEPGAEEAFYWASAPGFNWNADKEAGEPDHGGDPGGASVWYSWTAPGSGLAHAGASCGGKPIVAGVYTGDSLDTLAPVGSGEFPCSVAFTATVGTTYRIAIDGPFDSKSGGPALSAFYVYTSMRLPPQSHSSDEPAVLPPLGDVKAPETKIVKKTLKPAKRQATFAFRSSEPGSTFRCKLDGRAFVPCGSPKTYKGLKAGKHTFKVAAVDAAGGTDPTPGTARFSIPSRKHKKR